MTKLAVRDAAPPVVAETLHGASVGVPDRKLSHVQFRRFAGCPASAFTGEGGHTGLPADFLVGEDGRLLAVRYGRHADDQWSVDEIVTLAKPPPVGAIEVSLEGREDRGAD